MLVESELVELRFSAASLGGDDGWGYNHSDEGEGDEQIMHGVKSPVGPFQPLHNFIIGLIGKFLNPTKTSIVIRVVLPEFPPSC